MLTSLLAVTIVISTISLFLVNDLTLQLDDVKSNQIEIQQTIANRGKDVQLNFEKGYSTGNDAAPATLAIFLDYECGFCKHFFLEIYPKLYDDYISKDLLRFVIFDYPLTRHEFAVPIAQYARCAQEIGTYDVFRNSVFQHEELMTRKALDQIASESGININECTSDTLLFADIFENIKIGNSIGVRGTPSFVLNNQLIVGVKPYEELKSIIDNSLNRRTGTCK